nr:hypothetical protein Iba_chr05bCG8940 [Ipomoea batatas]
MDKALASGAGDYDVSNYAKQLPEVTKVFSIPNAGLYKLANKMKFLFGRLFRRNDVLQELPGTGTGENPRDEDVFLYFSATIVHFCRLMDGLWKQTRTQN